MFYVSFHAVDLAYGMKYIYTLELLNDLSISNFVCNMADKIIIHLDRRFTIIITRDKDYH